MITAITTSTIFLIEQLVVQDQDKNWYKLSEGKLGSMY